MLQKKSNHFPWALALDQSIFPGEVAMQAHLMSSNRVPPRPCRSVDDDGCGCILDPRFNAALTEVSETICAKLLPRAGLLTIFPGYLWHGVGPNRGTDDRYAIAANIGVVVDDEPLISDREFSH